MTKKHIIISTAIGFGIFTGAMITRLIVTRKYTAKLFERLDDIAEAIDDIAIESVDHTKIIERCRQRITNIDETLEDVRNHTDDIASCTIAAKGIDDINRVSIAIPKEQAAPTLSDINNKE